MQDIGPQVDSASESDQAKERNWRHECVRDKNPNWRGGRSLASNGYVLIRVGVGHHLADVRGYAYEHRLVAEEKIGRRLLPGEHVHHKDENRTNNHPDNLEVMASQADHFVEHRKDGSNKKLPSEPNVVVACECGCGEVFDKYDKSGRPRRYIPGHNPRDKTSQNFLLEAFVDGPKSVSEIAVLTNRTRRSIRLALSRLTAKGVLNRVKHGVYERRV